jgi:hypothetical protein
MRHIQDGDADATLDLLYLELQLLSEFAIERAKRLIEQQSIRLEHQCTRECDTLLLSARQFAGPARREFSQTDAFQHLQRLSAALPAGHPFHAQREFDVVEHAHMGEQCIALEDHAEVASFRWQIGDILAVNTDLPLAQGLETRHHHQCRGLARAAGSEQAEELPRPQREADITHHEVAG